MQKRKKTDENRTLCKFTLTEQIKVEEPDLF